MSRNTFRQITADLQLPLEFLAEPVFVGHDPIFPTRFRIAEAAAAIAEAAVAAVTLRRDQAGHNPKITVDVRRAAASLISFFFLRFDGKAVSIPELALPTTGFYRARDGRWVHLHGGFPHLHEGTLKLLGCAASPDAIATAVDCWQAGDLEQALADEELCGVVARTADEWAATPNGMALAKEPLVAIDKIGNCAPEPPPGRPRPLSGVRVLDLTRVLAGPTCARTLAEHGAEVLKITSPHLPFTENFVIDTGHGKRSACLDLSAPGAPEAIGRLVRSADVFCQGYRSGSLDRFGLSPQALHQQRPGIVVVSINCYGHTGPWRRRPGWEQLAQATTGLATGHGTPEEPQLIPAAVNDYITGNLAAYGAAVALGRRAVEGGSYHVRVSLCRTAMWIHDLGFVDGPEVEPAAVRPGVINLGGVFSDEEIDGYSIETETSWGRLRHLSPVADIAGAPPRWDLPPVPLGTDSPRWFE